MSNNNEIRAKFDALPSPEVSSAEVSRIPKGEGYFGRVIDRLEEMGVFGTYRNPDKGWDVIINSKSARANFVKSSEYRGKIALLEIAPELVKNGVFLETTPKSDGLYNNYFAAKAKIDGEERVVIFNVRSDPNGKRYYDHSSIKTMELDRINDQAPHLPDAASARLREGTTTAPKANTDSNSPLNILKKHIAVNSKSEPTRETPTNKVRNTEANIADKTRIV